MLPYQPPRQIDDSSAPAGRRRRPGTECQPIRLGPSCSRRTAIPLPLVEGSGSRNRYHKLRRSCGLTEGEIGSSDRPTTHSRTPPGDEVKRRSFPVTIALMESRLKQLGALLEVVEKLRGPGGCPWDREQTLSDLSRYLVEEACEVADAISESDGAPTEKVSEELGDLLMNVFLAACIATEAGGFTIGDVAAAIREKLIRRHPHVFAGEVITGAGEVLKRWREIKAAEQAHAASGGRTRPSRLDGIPRCLPPLARAYRLSERAARCGFDWPEAAGALEKLDEELREVRALLPETAVKSGEGAKSNLEEELGDVLFSAVNLCRKLGIQPDTALRSTIRKFQKRFQHIEARIGNLEEATLEEMDRVWDEQRHAQAQSDRPSTVPENPVSSKTEEER